MKRGFGSPNYNADRAKQVRQMGAQALRDQGKAHTWTPGPEGTAIDAGRKGGEKRSELLDAQHADEQQAA